MSKQYKKNCSEKKPKAANAQQERIHQLEEFLAKGQQLLGEALRLLNGLATTNWQLTQENQRLTEEVQELREEVHDLEEEVQLQIGFQDFVRIEAVEDYKRSLLDSSEETAPEDSSDQSFERDPDLYDSDEGDEGNEGDDSWDIDLEAEE